MNNQAELDPRNQQAISAALENNWGKAVIVNSELLEDYPEDIDVLNRLGRAHSELGQINKSRSTYNKVLEIDPYNPIAKKNLERLSSLRGSDVKIKDGERKPLDPGIFLEELGKTKTISVGDLAMPKLLANLRVGDEVSLSKTKDGVSVISTDSKRLGKINGQWGSEVSQAINLGSKFSSVIKSVTVGKSERGSSLTVFLRELSRSKKLIKPPFPFENNNFTPFVREDTLNYLKKETDHSSEEQEEVLASDLNETHESHHPEPTSDLIEPLDENIIEDEEDHSPA